MDPDRVVTKRIVLSGHPFKINKKHAVVRYMFFNRGQIGWSYFFAFVNNNVVFLFPVLVKVGMFSTVVLVAL